MKIDKKLMFYKIYYYGNDKTMVIFSFSGRKAENER